MKKIFFLFVSVLLWCQYGTAAILPQDIIAPVGLPPLGKWMFTAELQPSNWLGQKYQGKEFREPINVIIIDRRSNSTKEAITRLYQACRQAGYPSRWGHTGSYRGFIRGNFYSQLPTENLRAFSNRYFLTDNKHGRIFGPYFDGNKYLFTASFSGEDIHLTINRKKMHRYDSFNKARDDFASRLNNKTDYKIVKYVDLKNAVMHDPSLTTGDHDGRAVVLEN